MPGLVTQLINLFAALLLLLSFGLLAQRRVLSLIHLFTLQGITLTASTTAMAFFTEQPHLYWSCLLYTSPSPRDGLLSRMPSSA